MRVLPRDPLLYARLAAVVGALILLVLGVEVLAPFLELAILAVLGSSALIWRASLSRGGASIPLREIPPAALTLDLFAAAAWMLARALDPRGVAFVLVLAVGTLAMYRSGRAGLLLTIGTYAVARAGQEVVRVLAGMPTPLATIVGDTVVVGVALAIVSASVDANRRAEARSRHALVRARSLERSSARELEQARQLEAVSRLTAAEGSAAEVVSRIAQAAADVFASPLVLVVCVEDLKPGKVIAAVGTDVLAPEPLAALVREVAVGRHVVISTIEQVSPEGAGHPGDLHGIMAAPAMVGDRVAAAVIVTGDAARTFDVIDRRGLAAFAESVAVALRAADARQDRERRIQRLAALNVLASELAQVREPLRIARLAWEACGQLVARDSFYVARYDQERKRFHFLFQEDGGRFEESDTEEVWAGDMVVPLGTGPTSQVVLTGEAYVTTAVGDEVQSRSRRYGDHARESASAVHVPLKIGGHVVGVLSAQSYQPGRYDDEDVEILQSLANLVASALANVEHLARGRELYLASVKALAAAVDARDPYTRSHSARVAALSRLIAEELALPTDEIRRVQLGALLHDIGKIGIPDAILNKPAALSPDEWVIMKTHSALGASILAAVEPLRDLVQIVRCHHERFDGGGYPDGLRGAEIPLGSAIVTAADAYEVIVSKRSYKAAQSVEHAVSELLRCRGSQFHPDVVDAFLRVIERDRMHGTAQLRRVGSLEHEDIEDVPGPGQVLERYAARSQAHTRQLAILQRLASEISAIVDIDDLAQRLLRIVCDSMGYENGFLTTLDDNDDVLVVRAAVGPSIDYLGHSLARGQGISWWVVEHGVLQNVRDVHADTRFLGPGEIRSSLIVPLRIGDERVGVLGIESTHTDAFSADDEELLTVVSHQVAAAVRVARLHAVARSAAATDPLTSMPNRRAFFEHLELGLRRAAEGMPLSVAMVDIDLLKLMNDELGHGSGDEALVRIGRLLAAGVREDDVVARIGGDEFAIVFPGAPVLVAERIMRRLAEAISHGTLGSGAPLPTVSWGIAAAPDGRTTVDAIVDEADRAMYRHKELGRRRARA